MTDWRFVWNRFVRRRRLVDGKYYDWNMYFGPLDSESFLYPLILKKREGAFLDVGASIGLWSIAASPFYPRVFAFEPSRDCVQALKRNLRMNRLHNVEVCHFALGRINGSELQNVSGHVGRRDKKMLVTTRRLDDLSLPEISVVKIDTEGGALGVVKGGLKTIFSKLPALVIEAHTIDELDVPTILPKEYKWQTFHRDVASLPCHTAIQNGKQPFLVGTTQ